MNSVLIFLLYFLYTCTELCVKVFKNWAELRLVCIEVGEPLDRNAIWVAYPREVPFSYEDHHFNGHKTHQKIRRLARSSTVS